MDSGTGRQLREDGGDVDAAFAEIQPSGPADADQFFALGGEAYRRIVDLREVKPLARQVRQLARVRVAAIEMQRVDDDAGVGTAAAAHDVDRLVERPDA